MQSVININNTRIIQFESIINQMQQFSVLKYVLLLNFRFKLSIV